MLSDHDFTNAKSSAGFQPAVAQVFHLRCSGQYVQDADWKSATQQAESLRYETATDVLGRCFA